MLRKLLFISLALLLLGSALSFTKLNKTVLASEYSIDEAAKQQILAATVRISLFAPLTDNQGEIEYVTVDGQKAIQYVIGEGLGTLTRSGQDVFILTHDHWTLLTANLHKVQFHNVAGELLLEMSGAEFQQLIRYRDGGTMVLNAPNELSAKMVATGVGNGRSVQNSDTLLIAYRQPNSGAIDVAAMRLEKLSVYKEQTVYRLSSQNEESVVSGNSGGGVWVDGKLVGNMWTTILEQEVSRITGKLVSPITQTNHSFAAPLPASFEADF